MTNWDLVAIAAVLLIGVPHGGLDGAVARRVGWSDGVPAWLGFHLGYILLAALVVVLWWHWPTPSLAVFLCISGLHFGRSDILDPASAADEKVSQYWLPLIAHGGLISIAIPSLKPDLVAPLFGILIGAEAGAALTNTIAMLWTTWLLAVLAYCAYAWFVPVWRKPLFSLLILLALVFLLPPLVSFALYFCLWHSRRHTVRIWQSLQDETERKRSFVEATFYSLMAWISAGVFFIYLHDSFSETLLQLTFIGLAALTVPHMLLVDIADRLKVRRELS
jgi:Brp/Blh family beta-carotene 15,15'-monooxygenase